MTDKIELIKAEIERLRKYADNCLFTEACIGASCVLDQMEDFIDSLPEEHVSEDLEEASIKASFEDMKDRQIMEDSNERRNLYSRIFRRGFKAGAQWNNERVIKKACNWLKKHGGFTLGFPGAEVKDFCKYMEEQL